MRDTAGTLEFLRGEIREDSREWKALCQKLARTARDLPARYPSALAAQEATPMDRRVYDVRDVRQGMVAFFDDPNDSNPFGHVTTVWGRAKSGELVHGTNDARVPGGVSITRHSFFPENWGDAFQFASDWFNGVDLMMKQPKRPALGDAARIREAISSIEDGIKDIDRSIAFHQKAKHPRLVRALKRDKAEAREAVRALKDTVEKFS